MAKIALIDGDVIRYTHGATSTEHPFLKDANGKPDKVPASVGKVQENVDAMIKHICKQVGAKKFEIHLSGDTNFRNDIATEFPYKGKRAKVVKPYHWQTVSDYLYEKYSGSIITSVGNEADDTLAISQQLDKDNKVICSIDKDLLTVSGWHYAWGSNNREEKPLRYVDEDVANYNLMKQMLTGDWSTDSILGCAVLTDSMYKGKPVLKRKGIGDKGADKILSVCRTSEERWIEVQRHYSYLNVPSWKEYLTEMGRLLIMGQTPDDMWIPHFTYDEEEEWKS